jgi:integrase
MGEKITVRTVKALSPGETAWDGELRGFGVRRRGEGAPAYVVKARVGQGRGATQRWITIGQHGAWTPDTARARAAELLREARAGVDPAKAMRDRNESPTIAKLCADYLEAMPTTVSRKKGRPIKARTIATAKNQIDCHVLPLLGNKRAIDLRPQDIERFQRDIAAGKSARRAKTKPRGLSLIRGGQGVAARTVATLRTVYAWGISQGIVSENPCAGVTLFKPKSMERFLSGPELQALGAALDAAEAEWREWQSAVLRARKRGEPEPPRCGENPVGLAALRVLLLTGARKMEILGLQWAWVDFERGMLRLPDSKTGAKVIPLGAPALGILAGLPRIDGNPFVFAGGKKGAHLVGLQKIFERVKRRAGLHDLRIHDLRHAFASAAVMAGDSIYVVGKLLGHSNAATTQRYAHLADDPLRVAADRNARRLEAAMAGKSAEVVPIAAGQK